MNLSIRRQILGKTYPNMLIVDLPPWADTLAKLSHAPTLFKFAEYVDYVFIKTKLKYKTGKDFSRKKE